MTELFAHVLLFGRHHTTVKVGGLFWRYCSHIARGKHCWKWMNYDGYCSGHNASCYMYCERECADD